MCLPRCANPGICFGQAGIGKTLSASRYANWHKSETLLQEWGPRDDSDYDDYAALAQKRSVFFTPEVLSTPRQFKDGLAHISARVSICIEQHLDTIEKRNRANIDHGKNLDLIIIDASERLRPSALEYLRDRYDRTNIALILIGMPGIDKQFSRYPQLYSRVGFAHEYRPLADAELRFVLERRWRKIGQPLDPDDFTDAQAVAAIACITRGNFRLVHRLFTQIERIMKINELSTITDDVVEAAPLHPRHRHHLKPPNEAAKKRHPKLTVTIQGRERISHRDGKTRHSFDVVLSLLLSL